MISDGRIVDAKTIVLLQYAALNIFRQGLVMPDLVVPGIHVFLRLKP